MRKTLLSLFLAVCALPLLAADQHVVLRAARMIDGRSNAVITPGLVVIRGNHIEQVGGSAPSDAQIIDLGDVTLLPGLIDAHVHALLQGDVTSEDYDVQLFKESPAYRALRASKALKIGLEHGFTTMRDLETEGAGYTDVDLKRADVYDLFFEFIVPSKEDSVASHAERRATGRDLDTPANSRLAVEMRIASRRPLSLEW